MSSLRVHGDRYTGDGLIDFAVNVLQDRPHRLDQILRETLESRSYPDDLHARVAIAERHGRTPEEVLPLNGACESFWLLAHAFRPADAVCFHPAFTEGEAALRAVGTRVTRVVAAPPAFALQAPAVLDADAVLVTNPNNPTGRLEPVAKIEALARPGRLLFLDESFAEFAGDRESLAGRNDIPGLVVIRSISKLWSLAGIRAGYLLAPAEVVAELHANRQPWSVNALALAALTYTASDQTWARAAAARVARERSDLSTLLAAIDGVRVLESETNFLLLELRRTDVAERLRARGIAVRTAATFPGLGKHFVRVAVRTRAENRALARAVEKVLRD
jgi:histidinol-phosphate/aromatic aminotransferase/cobyric acid decarboxylase-like protein